jgi:Protein of unknown function (DUF4231)
MSKPGQTATLFKLFETLEIEPYKKAILQQRYLNVLDNFQGRANRLSFMFYSARIIITVGSILVPAFLSIQNSAFQVPFYWTTWVLSIFVTICNGLVTLFKVDKKYFFIHTTLELLHSEGWQYIGLSGRYHPKDAPVTPTHENQFLVFFHMAEKIKMRQVEEEYWKFTDTAGVGNATNQKSMTNVQTPAIQQGTLASLPVEQKGIMEGWMGDMGGLMPRRKITKPDDKIDGAQGAQSTPEIPRITSKGSMSVQSDMPESASPESGVVSIPQVQGEQENQVYKNTIVQVMSD